MADSVARGSEEWALLLRKLRESGVSGPQEEQADILQGLVHNSLQLENRQSLTGDDVILIINLFSDWSEVYRSHTSPPATTTTAAPALLNLTKLLRNICACVPINQSRLLSANVLDEVSLLLTTHTPSHHHTPSHLEEVVTATLQLLGNICVGFPEGQERVWRTLFPHTLRSILNAGVDDVGLVCMLVHNCTCVEDAKDRRRDLITTEGGVALLSHILHSKDAENNREWRSIFLRSFLEKVALSELHCVLVPDQHGLWTALLDTACDLMNDEDAESHGSGGEGEVWPCWEESECVILVRVWGGEVERMLSEEAAILTECSLGGSTLSLSHATQLNVRAVSSGLRLLCCLSIRKRYTPLLQNQIQLMNSAIALLRRLSELDGSDGSTHNLSSLKKKERETEKGPLFGLKRSLLQLMSSLLYHCTPMQERVRSLEAIPLILNQCHIDQNNPLDIMQWAVLTIRNLCEGNPANQEVISRLETRGVAEATVSQFHSGCEVEVTRSGKLRVKPKS